MANPPRVRTPLSQRIGDFRRGPLKVLVWGAAVVGVLLLMDRRTQIAPFSGVARALEYEVSTVATGTIDTLHVALFDDVQAGSIVATLDPAPVEARLATAQAEGQRLRAEIEAERAELQLAASEAVLDEVAELRRFAINTQTLALDLAELEVLIEGDRVELERLELLQRRALEMVDRELGPLANAQNFELQAKRLRGIIQNNEVLSARVEDRLREAEARQRRFQELRGFDGSTDARIAALTEAVSVQQARIHEIRLARQALVVRAPVSGQVSDVLARQGQSLLPGEPVARLVGTRAADIVAYLPEGVGAEVRAGDLVRVARPAQPWENAEAIVERVGPAIEEIPSRLWRDPAVAEFGRPLLIEGAAALEILPGEAVSVRLSADHL